MSIFRTSALKEEKKKPVDQGQYMVSSTLALLIFFFPDSQIVSRAAVPEGQCPVECSGYFVCPSIRQSIHPFV